jgi:tetratricopeptide (TPR) repeat protein
VSKCAAASLAIVLFAGTAAAQQAPSAELAARLAAGDSAWVRADHPAAFAAYDFVVRADSTHSTRALFRVGLLHAWANRFTPALSALRLYVRHEPSDLEGRVALARTNAWAARYGESLTQYDSVLARDPAYRDAVVGRAQTLAWADQIPAAEAALTRWLATHERDAEAWALLGQFQRWRGASFEAEESLRRALAADAGNATAIEQASWVRADTRPAALLSVVTAEDSEENAFTLVELGATLPTRRAGRFTASTRMRMVSVGLTPLKRVPGAHLVGLWQRPASSWNLRAELGVVDYTEAAPAGGLRERGSLRASGRAGPRIRVAAGVGREPFDEVFSTAIRAMMFTVADVDISAQASSRLTIGAAASRGRAEGVGVGEGRTTALGAIRFTPRRGTQLALTHRYVSWDAPSYGIFFSPQDWNITEASASWERTAELGLVLGGDLAIGSQGVSFEQGPVDRTTAPRAALRVGYRPVPGRELVAALVYANVAGAGAITASEYRYGSLAVTGRWTF